MPIAFSPHQLEFPELPSLIEAIIKTLTYSDIFDYPLTINEIHKFLGVSVTRKEVENNINNINQVNCKEGFYFFAEREEIVQIRKTREEKSKTVFKRAFVYGKIIGALPFVRMVGLTGSLAMKNLSNDVDIDFMLITAPKRLWIARAFAVTLSRFVRLLGDKICVNLLLSQNALFWKEHSLYSAREISQMLPITGFDTYSDFRVANLWTQEILPNVPIPQNGLIQSPNLQKIFEFPFWGKFGNLLEKWAMIFQLKIISKKNSRSNETNFSPDICQGNFHEHKKWTLEAYKIKLRNYIQ